MPFHNRAAIDGPSALLTLTILLAVLPRPATADDWIIQPDSAASAPQEMAAEAPPKPEDPGQEDILHFFLPANNLSGRGLLAFRDPFPLALLHLQLPVNTMEILREGNGKMGVNLNWANNFALNSTFLVDAEIYRLELGGWYALKDDFYIGADLSMVARDGGILDPVVDDFHDLTGLGKGSDRGLRPQNAYEIFVTDADGDPHDLDRGVGLGDLNLRAHWILNRGDRWFPAVATQFVTSLPTSTEGFGSNGVDFGLSLGFHKSILPFLYLHGNVGATYLTSPEVEGLRFERIGAQASGGVEVAVSNDLSFLFQATVYSPLLESPTPLDKTRNYLAGGLKWEFLEGFQFELNIIENLNPFRNSSDIAIVAGFDFEFD